MAASDATSPHREDVEMHLQCLHNPEVSWECTLQSSGATRPDSVGGPEGHHLCHCLFAFNFGGYSDDEDVPADTDDDDEFDDSVPMTKCYCALPLPIPDGSEWVDVRLWTWMAGPADSEDEVQEKVFRLAVTHYMMIEPSKFVFVQDHWIVPIDELKQWLSDILTRIEYKSIDDIQVGHRRRQSLRLARVVVGDTCYWSNFTSLLVSRTRTL